MTILRLGVALLIVLFLAMVLADHALASAHVWVVVDLPSSPPVPGSTFTTDLRISSWNGTAAALDLTVRYDPAVLNIVDFSTPLDSEFYPNCFADSSSYTSGQTRIACFQVTNWEAQDTPVSFGTLTWEVVGAVGSATDVTIEPIAVVDANWSPVEVLAYGQHIAIYAPVQAAFTASPTSGVAPLTVVFTNTSSGDYTESLWGFGDSVTSTLESPTYTYTIPGVYTVTLTMSGPGGTDALTRTNYITANESPPVTASITKTVTPTGQVNYGDELTYTLVISSAPGMQVGIYDPLDDTTWVGFVERPPAVAHVEAINGTLYLGGVITGMLEVTPTNQITVSFIVHAAVPGTAGWTVDVTNRACVYPLGGTLGHCMWSNEVTNPAFRPYDIYLPLVMRGFK